MRMQSLLRDLLDYGNASEGETQPDFTCGSGEA